MVAVGYVFATTERQPGEVILAAAEKDWSQTQLDEWWARQECCSRRVLENMLNLALQQVKQCSHTADQEAEIEHLSDQIQATYEEISLLHTLTQKLQISRSPAELAEMCLDRLHGMIQSEGNVIWIQQKHGSPTSLIEGDIPFDELGMAQLVARFEGHNWSWPFVKNSIQGSLLGADYPGLRSLVIVPVSEGPYLFGWILSCNPLDGREFGTVEGNLLSSIATILGTHLRNIDLYAEHGELMLSFVRSLVSTLDAKDPYTRGHSERVALIGRRLGEKLGLPEEDLEDIYLSGLLHDVGKIGVDDRILRKPGTLTRDEFMEIQKHPMIGFQILSELKNLQKILPGVRSHHETYNGKGYPDGLSGNKIPLMARILAVADSYDAMGSDRPYRNGISRNQIEAIFRRGAGEQWDERVIEAYFSIGDDVSQICADYSPTSGNLLNDLITAK